MPEDTLSFAVPAADPEDDDRHGCCCEHVVAELEAMPAPGTERYRIAREYYFACPHRELTPLEVWLGIHQNWRQDRPWRSK